MIRIKGKLLVQNRFHLAIPSLDIEKSMSFYSKLGLKTGRFNKEFCIIDFFGHQLVCHKVNKIDKQRSIYPRHFGMVLEPAELEYLKSYCKLLKIESTEFKRYENTPEEHETFFIKDPSGNHIEFKTYKDRRVI